MNAQRTDAHCGDYTIKGRDLRQLYAGFGRLPLNDGAIWSLSLAQSTLPPGHIGYEAWITYVADADCHGEKLAEWVKALARCMATVKPLLGRRRRLLVSSYETKWGDQAALDGLTLALYGPQHVRGHVTRAEEFGCHRDAYKRIRDLIAGCVLMQVAQFEDALSWAVAVQRRA
jgi:hypothetical protein